MNNKLPTDPARNGLVVRAAVTLAIVLVAMKIHAEVVNLGFASRQFGTNVESDGTTPLDSSFTFELGTFAGGFDPTSGNTDQWLSNWVPVQDSAGDTLPGAITPYTNFSLPPFGDYDGYASSVDFDHNNSPFESGSQAYVWGYDAQAGDAEWILMTNTTPGSEWLFPSTLGLNPNQTWTPGTADGAIVGDLEFFDGKGDFISIQTGAVSLPPAVPEPSTAVVLTTAAAFLGIRRRRPRARG